MQVTWTEFLTHSLLCNTVLIAPNGCVLSMCTNTFTLLFYSLWLINTFHVNSVTKIKGAKEEQERKNLSKGKTPAMASLFPQPHNPDSTRLNDTIITGLRISQLSPYFFTLIPVVVRCGIVQYLNGIQRPELH